MTHNERFIAMVDAFQARLMALAGLAHEKPDVRIARKALKEQGWIFPDQNLWSELCHIRRIRQILVHQAGWVKATSTIDYGYSKGIIKKNFILAPQLITLTDWFLAHTEESIATFWSAFHRA